MDPPYSQVLLSGKDLDLEVFGSEQLPRRRGVAVTPHIFPLWKSFPPAGTSDRAQPDAVRAH